MSTPTLYRLGALAGFLSGACMIIGRLLAPLPNTQPGEIVDLFSPFFALFFLVALYLGQREESGVLGGVAFIVLFTGLSAAVSLDYFGAFIRLDLPEGVREQVMGGRSANVFVASLLIFLVGEILFGISVIRAGVYPKIAAVMFMVGLIIPVVLHPTGIFPESIVTVSAIVAALGLIWWAIALNSLASTKTDPA